MEKYPYGFNSLNLRIDVHVCVCVCVHCMCVFVFYLDRGCQVGKDLRNWNANGASIPYDSRDLQHTAMPTISTFLQNLCARSNWSQKWGKQSPTLLIMYVMSTLLWKNVYFFPISLKTVLELNIICQKRTTLESWILAGGQKRSFPPLWREMSKWVNE